MKIIYVSNLVSEEKMNYIINNSINKPLQSIQKFHRLICEGMVKNKAEVKAISAVPMSRKIQKKIFWNYENEVKNGIKYLYLPFVNLRLIRQITILFSIIFFVIKESLNKDNEEKIFICDVLNTTISVATLVINKIFRNITVAVVTDLPKYIGSKFSLSRKINEIFITKYDGYILLTEQMNKVVNPKNKEYLVVEGIADISMKNICNKLDNKYEKKVFIYAGGLYQMYGVKTLVEAFLLLKQKDVELHIFGSGELEEYLQNIKDERVKYYGVVTNREIIEEELKATLLINPRFTNEEYTKYSFPSKNIEYMASGTPVLTTLLPGMPEEYIKYVFIINNETVEGMLDSLRYILTFSKEELNNFGNNAKQFILKNKNQNVQSKKILDFLTYLNKKNNLKGI